MKTTIKDTKKDILLQLPVTFEPIDQFSIFKRPKWSEFNVESIHFARSGLFHQGTPFQRFNKSSGMPLEVFSRVARS